MKDFRILCLAAGLLGLTAGACNDNSDTTTANLSVVRLTVDAPDTAKSGTNFGVQVRALNAGVAGVHDGHLTVTLPSPLTVISVAAPPGTSATFTNGASGGSVDWTLGTLDSNSQVKLDITTMGLLAPTEATRRLTVLAAMTAQGINPGDAVAQDDVTLTQ
ncbi:MAG TPA: hypothetical protein VJ776_07040 [Thermoanaerobaculia bacterium]|jgi:hypothetical protein|nr:hypothetical protein [Thermoanaerobaculia bacterium]